MEKQEQRMKKKEYIKPDIAVIPMDDEVKLLDHISGDNIKYGASDTGAWVETPGIGAGNGTTDVPDESKKNQMWDLWE
ncbi:MAG: hypothetical protein ACI3Y5_07645 [Prevotella sp.]